MRGREEMRKRKVVVDALLATGLVGAVVYLAIMLASTSEELAGTRGTLASTEDELQSTTETLTHELTEARGTLASTEDELTATTGELVSTSQELANTKGTLASTEDELQSTKETLTHELTEARGTLASTENELTATTGELVSTSQELADTKGTLASTEDELQSTTETLTHELTEARGTLASTEDELTATTGELADTKGTLSDLESRVGDIETLEARVAELDELIAERAPLIPQTVVHDFSCTGSMEPKITCLDSARMLYNYAPHDIVVGSVITFEPPKYCNEPLVGEVSVLSPLLIHRVIEVAERDGGVAFRTKGDANDVADDCWITPERILGYMTALYRGTFPEQGRLRDAVNAAKASADETWQAYEEAGAAYVDYIGDWCHNGVCADPYYQRAVRLHIALEAAIVLHSEKASIWQCWLDLTMQDTDRVYARLAGDAPC